ncbi:beta-mannosidase [Aureibaculum sp. A20]|uniref:Mannan endo-1,4-beta-mannosidase n=1 Tax=Aureibaculum flavum TaxID=2795986 RepID=A0ABS0WNM7_9FLAO|nr:glycosyl hydrolase [Aureibaculum flavum]MBJ2173547.1 beta-mannosidase [Aureibaculum flavum]
MMIYIKNNNLKFYCKSVLVFMLMISFYSCTSAQKQKEKEPLLVDENASESCLNLYQKLSEISKKGFAIGHQDATSYGISWKQNDDSVVVKSDVNEVVGDFPAVYGFDLGRIELASDRNLDSVSFVTMKKLMIDAHKKGGIITISWHADNPTTDGDSWDKTPAVADIIKGGKHRAKYELWVKRMATFIKSLKYNNQPIPMVFRPFHEMNGAWFWWGDPNCTATEYKQLWQETVQLLRDTHNVHNLLYAYSPNKLNPSDDYLKYYPGDDYVDILGIDIYDFNNAKDYTASVVNDLNLVRSIAKEKNKLYAFTETGLETIPTKNWYSEVLYPSLENSGIAWVLFWRNGRLDHHYMPYKGHSSESDFKNFEKLPKTLFLKDVNELKN